MAAVAAGVLALALVPSPGGADTVPALRGQAAELRRGEQAALLRLYADESALARARRDVARLERRSSALASRESLLRTRLQVVRRSLAASQERLSEILRTLYVEGEADPIAVILGAQSLDEAMVGVESLGRAAEQNRRIVKEARSRSVALGVLRRRLAVERHNLDVARLAARTAYERLAGAVARRRATLSDLRRRGDLAEARIARLQQAARQAERASAAITAASSSPAASTGGPGSAVSPGSAAVDGAPAASSPATPGTLVVDAVAYHLPGRTASGLPVGIGVIAVDPTVIPLGTRVFVPGYGPAVAADVGSAIKGAIIDLWMPSAAKARAWGRRTVTITVYGS